MKLQRAFDLFMVIVVVRWNYCERRHASFGSAARQPAQARFREVMA